MHRAGLDKGSLQLRAQPCRLIDKPICVSNVTVTLIWIHVESICIVAGFEVARLNAFLVRGMHCYIIAAHFHNIPRSKLRLVSNGASSDKAHLRVQKLTKEECK